MTGDFIGDFRCFKTEKMKRLAIFGTKDLAQTIIGQALETGEFSIFGYFEDFVPYGTMINGYQVYGNLENAIAMYKEGAFDCIFIAIGYNHFDAKERIYMKLKGIIPLANIISRDAIISKSAVLGEGICIGKACRIGPKCIIGDNVMITSTVLGHDDIIGMHCYLAGSISIAGFVNIGKRCFLGIGVLVADHISICDDVWIGLGMIVMKGIRKPGKYAVLQKIIKYE